MSTVKSPLLSISASGLFGRVLSFCRSKGQNRVRGPQTRTVGWSTPQGLERSRVAIVSQAYKLLQPTDLQGYNNWNRLRARLHSAYVLFLRASLEDLTQPAENEFFTYTSTTSTASWIRLFVHCRDLQTLTSQNLAPNYIAKLWDLDLNLLKTATVYYYGPPTGNLFAQMSSLQPATQYYIQVQRLSTGQPASGLFSVSTT